MKFDYIRPGSLDEALQILSQNDEQIRVLAGGTDIIVNIQENIDKLALADEIGALCCVNIAGSLSDSHWDGPHPNNLSEETFDITVDNVRRIIDAVKPRFAKYSVEAMPWVIPDSPASYLDLIKAVDREMFAVHLDPVNMINCPSRYYNNAEFIRECFQKLGPWIISCHAKDIRLHKSLTVHLEEVAPGDGFLNYGVFLQELNKLCKDTPLILEHLSQEEYPVAQKFVMDVGKQNNIKFTFPKGVIKE